MRAIILTGVSAASSKRRATLLRPSIDVILFAHFSRGAKNKRAFNESSRRPSQRSPTPNSSSQRAVARSIGGRLSDSKRLARDSRNLSTVSAAYLACGVKSPRLFVTSASFSENNKRICSVVGHVLALSPRFRMISSPAAAAAISCWLLSLSAFLKLPSEVIIDGIICRLVGTSFSIRQIQLVRSTEN